MNTSRRDAKWHHQWQQARAQWQANPRLQWGAWLIVLILLLWLNLVLGDYRQALIDEYRQLSSQQQDQQSLLQGEDWMGHLQQARTGSQALDQHFGRANSEALARAEVQNRLSKALNSLAINQPKLDVSRAPARHEQLQLIPFEVQVSGRTQGDMLLKLLENLESGSPLMRISALTVNNQMNDYLYFTLQATVWYHPFGAHP